jgi:hypothetical protein
MVSPELSPNTKTYTLPQIIQVLAQVELASDERTTIAQQILAWTNGQPELTECLAFRVLDVIPHNSDVGPPVELVNNQVREFFTPALLKTTLAQSSSMASFWIPLRETLLQDQQQNYRLLKYYQAVLLNSHHLLTGYQPEQETLLSLGLLRQDERKQIKVANPIYRRVFSVDWVEQQLSQPFRMEKGHWVLVTSLLSILMFIVLQSMWRYVPISATYRCNEATDLTEAILAKLSLDPTQMHQSINHLLSLQEQGQLSEQCQSILYDLQYHYAIHVAAGTHNHPLDAATYLCQIPESYYTERNSVPWFSRWSNLYHNTNFAESLTRYIEHNPCPSYTFLNRASP